MSDTKTLSKEDQEDIRELREIIDEDTKSLKERSKFVADMVGYATQRLPEALVYAPFFRQIEKCAKSLQALAEKLNDELSK
jgi:hypothetical protein